MQEKQADFSRLQRPSTDTLEPKTPDPDDGKEGTKKFATISFPPKNSRDFEDGPLNPGDSFRRRDAQATGVVRCQDELFVRTQFSVFSRFARQRHGLGGIDWDMENQFACSKYEHFRGAFAQASVLMGLGALCLAVLALVSEEWLRFAVLLGFVGPTYFVYSVIAAKMDRVYFQICGTPKERILVLVLCFQTLCIMYSESDRVKNDYGMLVMHCGFLYNFTPFGTVTIHVVAAIFGLVPYVIMRWWKIPNILPPEAHGDRGYLGRCVETTGAGGLVLDIMVPCITLLYQGIVTMRRDVSMRVDMLSSKNSKKQRQQLNVEQHKCEDLLLSMLPKQIISSLKAEQPVEPQLFKDCTVIFVDVCDLTDICAQLPPKGVLTVLKIIYLELDRLSDLLHVYKVESVGQIYMAVAGCPQPMRNHADVAAHFALAAQTGVALLRRHIQRCARPLGKVPPPPPSPSEVQSGGEVTTLPGAAAAPPQPQTDDSEEPVNCRIRVGLNSGKLRAGVVGLESPRFKLFGDTVNTASRMESTCEPGKVQVSLSCQCQLTETEFQISDRGEIPVKGKGTMKTFYLHGYVDGQNHDRTVRIDLGTPRSSSMDSTPSNGKGAHGPDRHAKRLATNADLNGRQAYQEAIQAVRRDPKQSWNLYDGTPGTLDPALKSWEARASQGLELSPLPTLPTTKPADHIALTKVGKTPRWSFDHLSSIFLLVPASQRRMEWMNILKRDRPIFIEDTLDARISHARNLTIMWLVILVSLSLLDFSLDTLAEDLLSFKRAIAIRTVGCVLVSLFYLIVLTKRKFFLKYSRSLTVGMLVVQGASILWCGMEIYNSEPAMVSAFGSYVLLFNVCTISWRLALCIMAVVGFVAIEVMTCGKDSIQESGKLANIAFLMIFFFSMACGVHLEEHLQHVAYYEQRLASRKLVDIKMAQRASVQLLTNLLPQHVVPLVSDGISPIAEVFHKVTVIFTDIKGFTAYSSKISPQELVDFLNAMYSAFDEVIVNWGLYKVEIIGDAYVIAAGCPAPPHENDISYAEYAMRAVEVALAMQRSLPAVCEDSSVKMRVGIHTGSIVAGVVSKKGPRYHLFGAAVAYAEKMESHGLPGRVQVSDSTHSVLAEAGHNYEFEERHIEIEGERGVHRTWLVNKSNNRVAFQIQKKLIQGRRRSIEIGPL